MAILEAKLGSKSRGDSLQWVRANAFAVAVILMLIRSSWAKGWLISGAPLLTYVLIGGAASGTRILPFVPLWTLIASINFIYGIASTSWLLYWVFTVACYPTIFFASLFQFHLVSDLVRKNLRKVLKEFQFTADKISLFDLPALEIDRDVDGLMVIRGVTISLSSLTIVAHGIEVGIKFSDDMELALVVDQVVIKLFRRIDVGDVFGNVKGGEHEMNFHALAPNTKSDSGEALMNNDIFNMDTPLLKSAAAAVANQPDLVKMTEEMTENDAPKDESPKAAFQNVTQIDLDDEHAESHYAETIRHIEETSIINESRQEVIHRVDEAENTNVNENDEHGMLAAICTRLHHKPTVAHPPKRSVKVTTLQNMSRPAVRRFLHRLPLLLRLLLNPVAYFHPVFIKSITAGASGRWAESMINQNIFKQYATDNSDIKRLQKRISSWLVDANFCIELLDIKGVAQVPVNTNFDILSNLKIDGIRVYRAVPREVSLKQVIKLGGADATIAIPSYLLPHHEHLLPPPPLEFAENAVSSEPGSPAQPASRRDSGISTTSLKMATPPSPKDGPIKDEAPMTISTHVRLPAKFDQSLLDFSAALIKATKIVEMDRDADEITDRLKSHSFKEITKAVNDTVKNGLKKATIDAMANDRWIAKLVGKVTNKLEIAQGDLGYSGTIPIDMKVYRDNAESMSKLLP